MVSDMADAYSLHQLISKFVELKGSDLYLTVGFAPSVRVEDKIVMLSDTPMTDEDVERLLTEMLNAEKLNEFRTTMEYNGSMHFSEGRFRINAYRQQQHSAVVIRHIRSEIPTAESLKLPKPYTDTIMENRGLILVVGPTGSGKSTSLAAMIGHRNEHGYGHILTIEEPIEFLHQSKGCIISQRDVGLDTYSFEAALKNALRQRPDVVLIGEIRDHETMEHAINFSETGHLCVATLHAGNSAQALERVLSFFPEEKRKQVSYALSSNLLAIFSQRLVLTLDNKRTLATEVMLNRGFIRSLVQENKGKDLADIIAKNTNEGMHTFEQSLYQLYIDKVISAEVAIAEADIPSNMQLLVHKVQASKGLLKPGSAIKLDKNK